MKVKYEFKNDITLEELAKRHNLVMRVIERDARFREKNMRFYAKFEGVEAKGNFSLTSVYGDGNTGEEAIFNYCKEISNRVLVKDAYKDTRVEIDVPTVICAYKEEKV